MLFFPYWTKTLALETTNNLYFSHTLVILFYCKLLQKRLSTTKATNHISASQIETSHALVDIAFMPIIVLCTWGMSPILYCT